MRLTAPAERAADPRFWRSVASAAVAGFTRDFCSKPWQMVRIGLWGWAATLTFSVLVAWALTAWLARFTDGVPDWEPTVLTVLFVAVCPFLMGTEIARRSKGRDVAAAAATVAACTVMHLVATVLSARQQQSMGRPWPGREYATLFLAIESAALFAGAAARRLVAQFAPGSACFSRRRASALPELRRG